MCCSITTSDARLLDLHQDRDLVGDDRGQAQESSSAISRRGSSTSTRASVSMRCSLPESEPATCPPLPAAGTSCTPGRAPGTPLRPNLRNAGRGSPPRRAWRRRTDLPRTTPARTNSCASRPVKSWPSTSTLPFVGTMSPETRATVVLPMPLWPTIASVARRDSTTGRTGPELAVARARPRRAPAPRAARRHDCGHGRRHRSLTAVLLHLDTLVRLAASAPPPSGRKAEDVVGHDVAVDLGGATGDRHCRTDAVVGPTIREAVHAEQVDGQIAERLLGRSTTTASRRSAGASVRGLVGDACSVSQRTRSGERTWATCSRRRRSTRASAPGDRRGGRPACWTTSGAAGPRRPARSQRGHRHRPARFSSPSIAERGTRTSDRNSSANEWSPVMVFTDGPRCRGCAGRRGSR